MKLEYFLNEELTIQCNSDNFKITSKDVTATEDNNDLQVKAHDYLSIIEIEGNEIIIRVVASTYQNEKLNSKSQYNIRHLMMKIISNKENKSRIINIKLDTLYCILSQSNLKKIYNQAQNINDIIINALTRREIKIQSEIINLEVNVYEFLVVESNNIPIIRIILKQNTLKLTSNESFITNLSIKSQIPIVTVFENYDDHKILESYFISENFESPKLHPIDKDWLLMEPLELNNNPLYSCKDSQNFKFIYKYNKNKDSGYECAVTKISILYTGAMINSLIKNFQPLINLILMKIKKSSDNNHSNILTLQLTEFNLLIPIKSKSFPCNNQYVLGIKSDISIFYYTNGSILITDIGKVGKVNKNYKEKITIAMEKLQIYYDHINNIVKYDKNLKNERKITQQTMLYRLGMAINSETFLNSDNDIHISRKITNDIDIYKIHIQISLLEIILIYETLIYEMDVLDITPLQEFILILKNKGSTNSLTIQDMITSKFKYAGLQMVLIIFEI